MVLRALALCRHRRLVTFGVERQASLSRNVIGQIDRKAISVIELKNNIARNHTIGDGVQRIFQYGHTVVERAGKLRFFTVKRCGNCRLMLY